MHEKREACIRKKYNADEIGQRILNGDGGSWIKEPYDPETIFQLDRYHIYQEILRKISNKEAQKIIRDLFDEENLEENEKYLDSIQGKIDQFNNAVQTMWMNVLNDEVVKWIVRVKCINSFLHLITVH